VPRPRQPRAPRSANPGPVAVLVAPTVPPWNGRRPPARGSSSHRPRQGPFEALPGGRATDGSPAAHAAIGGALGGARRPTRRSNRTTPSTRARATSGGRSPAARRFSTRVTWRRREKGADFVLSRTGRLSLDAEIERMKKERARNPEAFSPGAGRPTRPGADGRVCPADRARAVRLGCPDHYRAIVFLSERIGRGPRRGPTHRERVVYRREKGWGGGGTVLFGDPRPSFAECAIVFSFFRDASSRASPPLFLLTGFFCFNNGTNTLAARGTWSILFYGGQEVFLRS